MQQSEERSESTPPRVGEKPNVYVIEGQEEEEGSDKWPSMNEAAEESSEKEPAKYSPPA